MHLCALSAAFLLSLAPAAFAWLPGRGNGPGEASALVLAALALISYTNFELAATLLQPDDLQTMPAVMALGSESEVHLSGVGGFVDHELQRSRHFSR